MDKKPKVAPLCLECCMGRTDLVGAMPGEVGEVVALQVVVQLVGERGQGEIPPTQ